MPRDEGRIAVAAPADVNKPDSAQIVHIFVDSADGDKVKAKLSDDSVKELQAGGDAVALV